MVTMKNLKLLSCLATALVLLSLLCHPAAAAAAGG